MMTRHISDKLVCFIFVQSPENESALFAFVIPCDHVCNPILATLILFSAVSVIAVTANCIQLTTSQYWLNLLFII